MMVKTVKNHPGEEEEDDEDFMFRTTDGYSQKDGRRSDQKASSHRSKHSETEQRRRVKINERFQVLSDLIPQNDQKRDRASFLLEVIQYIQFLQEKLQIYEGTHQCWSPGTKLMAWRGNCGEENFIDQSQLIKHGSGDEDNIALTPSLLTDTRSLVGSDLNCFAAFRATNHGVAQSDSIDVPLQQNLFEAETPQGSFPDVEILSQSQPQPWNHRPFSTECTVPNCTPNEIEELKMQSEESNISNAYSEGLLNNLKHALGSSGVDLSHTNISVQFDIRKGTSSGVTSRSFGTKDHECLSPCNQPTTYCGVRFDGEDRDQAHKKPRTERSQ